MPKGPRGEKRPADMNQLAKMIVDIATGEKSDNAPARGRPGGLSGGKARAEKLILNGPALKGPETSQDDIDALFA